MFTQAYKKYITFSKKCVFGAGFRMCCSQEQEGRENLTSITLGCIGFAKLMFHKCCFFLY